MCQVLQVNRSGYYAWLSRPESKRSLENKELLSKIRDIYRNSHRTYGSPRITAGLHDSGYSCSRPRVARLMRVNGIQARTKRKFKVTTNSDHDYPVAPNLLNQNFETDAANKVWVGDITYIRTWEGWLYLTIVLDLFHHKVVGWSMSDRLTADTTTIPALLQALKKCQPTAGLIFHSDQGIQYACNDYRTLLNSHKIIQSMSGKGNCYDNAVAESFFHNLKTEWVYHETYRTRKEARTKLFEYIEVFYNRVRKHSTLGYKSPEQFEQLNYKQVI